MMLANKIAIVTGGGLNIGLEISRAMAKAGAKVVIADIAEEAGQEAVKELSAKYGAGHIFVKTDMMSEDSIKAMVDTTLKTFGRIDCLVNNAGIAGAQGVVENISLEDWRVCLGINLDGVFLACKHAVPAMKQQRSGSIVNIASMTGKSPLHSRSPYCASKMAVIGLTRCLALELGEFGVRANSVCPGAVDGPRVQLICKREAEITGRSYEEVLNSFTSKSPLKQLIPPSAIADVVVYLCGGEGAAMMTGEDVNVTAGAAMY